MTSRTQRNRATEQRLAFQIHPRAFKALGADLVTNDVVAIIELVKNAYDASATVVEISFGYAEGGDFIEITDNGTGMDLAVLKEAWCTVATPYRQEHPVARLNRRTIRRAAGAKGLGRLSAARLGAGFDMLTQTEGGECWHVRLNWKELAEASALDGCFAICTRHSGPSSFERSGTQIRISQLRAKWDEGMIDDLCDNLARLLPPFDLPEDFEIRLNAPERFSTQINIRPPEFLNHPKYVIRGKSDRQGLVTYEYEFHAIQGGAHRKAAGKMTWEQIKEESDSRAVTAIKRSTCGPFAFEIRAWDIAPQDTTEIAERFKLKKSTIRRDIRAYKGISVYRDGVLVLPKSEGARDWLGLDLRRVGKVGPRLSTPQIVGLVSISADDNPGIEDTSDRERLADTPEVAAFEAILRAVVSQLENERDKDRRAPSKERRVVELFEKLNASDLVAGVTEVVEEGGTAAETLPLVQDFSARLDKVREEIETRFVYYSRLATVGTIAQMLVHEVRNRTTVIGNALLAVKKAIADNSALSTAAHRVELADGAVASLEKLADTFAPLANRSFRRRMRTGVAEESILRCAAMIAGDLKAKKIRIRVPERSVTEVAVDPGELDAIVLNLFTNSVYWLSQVPDTKRVIQVRLSFIDNRTRVRIHVDDSGPGVPDEDAERIFWPGVTNKPGGIGMGLTVASELVSEYGGQLALATPGKLGGATFFFDLPVRAK